MNQTRASLLLVVSVLLSCWLYWGSDIQLEKAITSREWQSKMVTVVNESMRDESVGPLRKADVISNVKYLPNGTYIRFASVNLFANSERSDSMINISETGRWEISENYLLITPTEFKDVSSANSKDFSESQMQLIKQILKMDAQQSRRIDIVNEKTILLTSLNHGSGVLFSN